MKTVLITALFLLIDSAFCGPLVPEEQVSALWAEKKKTVAFYSVLVDGDQDEVVKKQIKTIASNGLLDKLDSVYYTTMGKGGKDYDIGNDRKYVHVADFGEEGSQLHTMNLLQNFCSANPTSKVLYFHNNGSSHLSNDEQLSPLLNCFVLNTNCIDTLDHHDICGWRISPIPQPHYPGNFWWARCQYVNSLISPLAPLNNQTYIQATDNTKGCVAAHSQAFTETWIGTGPTFLPADCMNSTMDASYVFGNDVPSTLVTQCPGPDALPGTTTCQTASTLQHAADFSAAVKKMEKTKAANCGDSRSEVIKLSNLMYGEAPHSYLRWMDKLYSPSTLADHSMVRFADQPQIYFVRDETLHAVPNLKTLMHLRKHDEKVHTLTSSDRTKYALGKAIPSI